MARIGLIAVISLIGIVVLGIFLSLRPAPPIIGEILYFAGPFLGLPIVIPPLVFRKKGLRKIS